MDMTIRGNEINEKVLREVRSLLIKPVKPVITLVVLAVYAGMSVVAIGAQLWFWLPVFTAILLFFLVGQPYIRQERVINQMLSILRKTYGSPSCSFDVTFEPECIKSINVRTRETVRLPYADFIKMKQGKTVLALVTRRGHLVVLEYARMDEPMRDAVMATVRERCVNIAARPA